MSLCYGEMERCGVMVKEVAIWLMWHYSEGSGFMVKDVVMVNEEPMC